MENERKQGFIQMWTGRWGHISFTNKTKFFLHISEFDAPREPLLGEYVTFEVAPPFASAISQNRLSRAVNVRPFDPNTETADVNASAIDVLSGDGGSL